MDLTGKTILVTGASAGLCKETAITLSKLGAKVIAVARNAEALKETVSLMDGYDNAYYVFDLKKIDEIETLVKTIVSEHGKLDGLVHCAGIATMRPLKMTTYEFLHDMMLVNFYSFV